ncbi:DExH-box splicing factor binding site-domain-containing protein [Boletus edulis BED1]|uniref:DExH-box splicing factor binding site-domain-containing protein n=1 Tax=Boletus edulis BED1 TaxID=1328754 RepID=A0AAD4BYX2_BOLED|nr:DExH-box splicing factor binding site-domain-containing protein [Boletus edulis BED1]
MWRECEARYVEGNLDSRPYMPSTPSTVSFTVRRSTPVSRPSSSRLESDRPFKIPALPRHLANAGSSATGSPLAGYPRTFSPPENEDDDEETGIVFANRFGADDASHHTDSSDEENLIASSILASGQRFPWKKTKAPAQEAPLVVPTRPNPDWREAAKRRRAGCSRAIQPHTSRATPALIPDSALAATGADGSVGGLGTRDTINSGPHLSGLQIKKRVKLKVEGDGIATMEDESAVSVDRSTAEVVKETEDQRALRAILAGDDEAAPVVDRISLPDIATTDDYERVPISAFGAAMLRGMGWTEGAVAPKSDKRGKNGLMELYLPQARPALLGISAKEREPQDDGSGKPKGPDMRYIPVARRESGRGENEPNRSGTVSRRGSRSPPLRESDDGTVKRDKSAYDDRERRKERDRDRDRDRDDGSRRRTRDYNERVRERKDYRDRDQYRDRDPDRDRDRDRDQDGRSLPKEGKEREYGGRTRPDRREDW